MIHEQMKNTIFDKVYPIGSINLSVKNTNPQGLFTGKLFAWG